MQMQQTLYGTMARTSQLVGFCYRHHAGITVRQLKRKRCLAKQCNALKRYENHPYWQQRLAAKEKKKRRMII